MNKKIIIVTSVVIIIFIIASIFMLKTNKTSTKPETNSTANTNQINEQVSEKYEEMKNTSTMYDENATLEELKEEYQITGSDDIYEIETESDGRKVINVKASVNYKVAFCGMIKQAKPSFGELDSIFEQNHPNNSGFWIRSSDSSKILSYLNNSEYLKSKYEINEEGYLQISQKNNQTEYDKQIETLINSDKQYIINISSLYYMIDTVTGEIIDNPYNELDIYQTYDYCTDEDKTIIFISENKDKNLTNDEIFLSVIDLLKSES